MTYSIECDWQKVPKEGIVGIMGVEEPLSTSLCFVVFFFGVFSLFAAYEFWFVFFMECRRPAHELVMELGSQDSLLL
jgi:hypothetical protein